MKMIMILTKLIFLNREHLNGTTHTNMFVLAQTSRVQLIANTSIFVLLNVFRLRSRKTSYPDKVLARSWQTANIVIGIAAITILFTISLV